MCQKCWDLINSAAEANNPKKDKCEDEENVEPPPEKKHKPLGPVSEEDLVKLRRAELRWILIMVESNFSFKSADNMVQLLDKDSKILPKMTLSRTKCGYNLVYLNHAVYPF